LCNAVSFLSSRCAATVDGASATAHRFRYTWEYIPVHCTSSIIAFGPYTSVRSNDLSGLDVDKDILLAILRRLDLDHVDILAFLPLDRHGRGLAGDLRERDLRRLVSRDLRHGRRILQRFVVELPDA